VAKPSSTPE
jgi:hypothetical protein